MSFGSTVSNVMLGKQAFLEYLHSAVPHQRTTQFIAWMASQNDSCLYVLRMTKYHQNEFEDDTDWPFQI